MKLAFFLLTIISTTAASTFDPSTILNIDNLTFPSTPISALPFNSFFPEPELHGRIDINDKDNIFYWLFPSRSDPDKDPLVVWLTGGPGCASELALFFENGPMALENGEAVKKDISWNNRANLVYFDQPIGVGFSDGDDKDIPKSEKEVADYFEIFIIKFYEKFPAFKGRDLFITGESFGGHYVPSVSERVNSSQKCKDAGIKLIGSAIGNGWVNPAVQYMYYAPFAYEHKIISLKAQALYQMGFNVCATFINMDWVTISRPICDFLMSSILGGSDPQYNQYDVRLPCEVKPLCYDFGPMDTYLNRDDVQKALDLPKQKWETCSGKVYQAFFFDFVSDVTDKVKALEESGVRFLVYNGDYDYSVNWLGGYQWIKVMDWAHQEEFNAKGYTNIGFGDSIRARHQRNE